MISIFHQRISQQLVAIALVAVGLFVVPQANAALTLSTIEDGVHVYSGPGERFRVIAILPNGAEIKASNQVLNAEAGRFYRVVVKTGETSRAIGFIPVNAPIRLGGEDEDEDELSKYGAVALISKAAQVTFASLRDKESLWTVGYMHYLSPGFYAKGFFGQWITPFANGSLFGGEIGNDSLLFGSTSGYVTYGLGIFNPGSAGAFYAGSLSMNLFMNATFGIRYNIEGFASVAVGGIQATSYNQNNSMVSTGVQVSLEVGI